VPGLKVLAPATPYDAKGLLKSAIRDGNPVVFIEGEMLYNLKGEVPEGEYTVPIGVADVKREGRDVTIIAHSKTVAPALKAAEELAKEGLQAEVVDPRTIRPLDVPTMAASVRKTHRCVIAEEGWPFAGVGAQFAYDLQRECFDDLDAPILRVTGEDVPMPYNKQLEKAAKVDAGKIVAACKQVLYLA
jgi:pyruvate dehydrogenase E1 component beta subunit